MQTPQIYLLKYFSQTAGSNYYIQTILICLSSPSNNEMHYDNQLDAASLSLILISSHQNLDAEKPVKVISVSIHSTIMTEVITDGDQ